ncbi:MAG: SRPBCC family protein [Roseivirga sp.]|nr:SRPBCC family protein [Roseivirga sp.]
MKIENHITIQATPELVWEVFTDDSKIDKWLTGFKQSKTISGEPLQVGSKHEMTFLERGKEMTFLETVTQVVPAQEYSFNLSNDMMTSKNKVSLKAKNGATELCQIVDFKAQSFGFKLMMFFMKGAMKKRNQSDLERLKHLIENTRI